MIKAHRVQLKKLRSQAWHLLDGVIALQSRYAMLRPMLFDHEVLAEHGLGRRAIGFSIIKNNLFLYCCQDIANLCLDRHESSVSIANVIRTLENPYIQCALEDEWVQAVHPVSEDAEIEAYWSSKRKERRELFRSELSQLQAMWSAFSKSQELLEFETIRKKVTAHKDISLRHGKYELLELSVLGVTWNDVDKVIREMQSHLVLIGSIVRDASFSWPRFEQQANRWSSDFWLPSHE